jgi:hypothetical protein
MNEPITPAEKTTFTSPLKISATKAPVPKVVTSPDLPFKAMICEGNVDLSKPAYSKFDGDPCKKVVRSFEQLLVNLMIRDETVIINHAKEFTSNKFLGDSGMKMPNNMTSTCNFFAGLKNPRIFQSKAKVCIVC